MPRKRPLAPARPRIPHLDHAILAAGDDAQRVGRERPHALDMAEQRLDIPACPDIPQLDGVVERAG